MQVWHIPSYWETLAFRKDSFRRLRQCAEVDVPKAYRLPSAKGERVRVTYAGE